MNKKPLNCEEAERLIPLYVAGLLDDPAPLEAHLKTCRACREKVERERFIEDTLRTLKPYQPPPGLKEDILKAVKRPHGFSRLVRQPLFWTFIGTATVILILAALFLAKPKPKLLEAAPLTGEVLFPTQDAVILAKDFKLVFVYAPERPDIDVSVYLDDGEITGTVKSVDGLIVYQSPKIDEGYHKIWVRLKDRKTGEEKEFQRLVYVIGGEKK